MPPRSERAKNAAAIKSRGGGHGIVGMGFPAVAVAAAAAVRRPTPPPWNRLRPSVDWQSPAALERGEVFRPEAKRGELMSELRAANPSDCQPARSQGLESQNGS